MPPSTGWFCRHARRADSRNRDAPIGSTRAGLPVVSAGSRAKQGNAEALHLLGVLHHQQGNQARAIELISRAVAIKPNSHIYHANLAEAFRATGDFDRAAGSCRAALQLWADYPEALCNLGAALQGMEQSTEAVEHLERALVLRPNFVVAHSNLGIALRDLGRKQEALEHFKKAVELDPAFAPAQTNLGQTLQDLGQAEEALPHCQEAVRLDPNSAVLHHNLGNTLRAARAAGRRQGLLPRGFAAGPEARARRTPIWGWCFKRRGSFHDALVWLKKAVELEPANVDFWQWLAELHDEMEESGEAIPCWERVVAFDPDRASAHVSLGWALQDESRFAEARDHYDAAIQLQPDYAAAYLNLGGLQEELGEMTAAEKSFRTALEKQASFALPHARLATLLRSKLPEADLAALEERLKDETLAETPRARLLFALAHALDGKGEFARAAECLREQCTYPRDQSHAPRLRRGRSRAICRQFAAGLRSRLLRAIGRCRLAITQAGLRFWPAALGHDLDRAGLGEPFAGLWCGRAAAGTAIV